QWGTHVIDNLRRYLPNLHRLSFCCGDFRIQWIRLRQRTDILSKPSGIDLLDRLSISIAKHWIIWRFHNPHAQRQARKDNNEDDDPTRVIEHFNSYLQDNYKTSPAFFVGTLEQAVKAALHLDAIENVHRVIIQLVDDGDFTRIEHDIEQELRLSRPEMIFRIKSA
ncbi:unnamed protein product, partial [Didymodactylos carnosus]